MDNRYKTTDTTMAFRLTSTDKHAFLSAISQRNFMAEQPYKYKAGFLFRAFIKAYIDSPELIERVIEPYKFK
jgi:hypothetical protein